MLVALGLESASRRVSTLLRELTLLRWSPRARAAIDSRCVNTKGEDDAKLCSLLWLGGDFGALLLA